MADLDERIKQLSTELETLKQNSDSQKILGLEEQVKEVAQDASDSPQQEQAQNLLSAVISLRQQATKSNETSEKLKRVRTQIYAVGSSQVLYEAVSTLTKVLENDPENTEARALAGELRARHPDFVADVRRILPETLPPKEVVELINRMIDVYYQAKYKETINLCNEILTLDSANATAWDFLRKADENITGGYVPDTNLPQGAYKAYSRGISAKTEGLFEEARSLFLTAQEIAQSNGFDWWKEPENQLKDIDLYLSEKRLVEEGDNLVRTNLWPEAIIKYENAWELKHFPRTKKKHDLLIELLQIYQAEENKSTLHDYLISTHSSLVEAVGHLVQQLDEAIQDWPESEKLQNLKGWVREELPSIGKILREQGEEKIDAASKSTAIKASIRCINEALEHLKTARALLPKDSVLEGLLHKAENFKNRIMDNQTLIQDNETTMEECSNVEVGARSPQITNVLVKLKNRANLVIYDEYRDLLTRVIEELLRCGDQAITQNNLQQAGQHFKEAENAYKVIFSVEQGAVAEGDKEIQQRHDAVKSLKERLRNQIKFKLAECSGIRQQYKDAISLLEDLLREDPSDKIDYELSIARYQKLDQLLSNEQDGKRYYRVQNWEKAVEFLKKALDSGSTDPEVEKFYERANKQLYKQLNGWSTLTFSEKTKLVVPILLFVILWILTGFLIAANVLH